MTSRARQDRLAASRTHVLALAAFGALLGLSSLGCTSQPPQQGNVSDSLVVNVNDANFSQEVLEADQPVLVDLWAPWCPPCVAMKPALAEVSGRLDGEVKVVEINVDENPFVSEKYEISALPTLLVIVDGEVVERSVGGRAMSDLLTLVEPYRKAQ